MSRRAVRAGEAASSEAEAAVSAAGPRDEELIALVLAGESEAFALLLARYQDLVTRIVAGKAPRDQAPELVHEVFVRCFESLGSFRPEKPFGHWLATLAVRTCYDFWRARGRRKETVQSALSEAQLAQVESVAAGGPAAANEALERFETWELLDWALGHLSPGDRMALTLVHLEGYSVAEAAQLLGWTTPMVKVRSSRARRKLRQLIGRILPAGEDSGDQT
ncbi:MAG: RNA polymerase sigma factor [Deltaproteobacteria bacterium]|nr:RNA polymerase sigma factor [Deltaproteobacteria bacterium]